MSNAKTVQKVLRVALKRVQSRHTKNTWGKIVKTRDDDGNWCRTQFVCLEGAVTGGQPDPRTPQQAEALRILDTVIREYYPERTTRTHGSARCIPDFNDHHETTLEDVERVTKIALQRSEEGITDPEADYVDEEEIADLFSPKF